MSGKAELSVGNACDCHAPPTDGDYNINYCKGAEAKNSVSVLGRLRPSRVGGKRRTAERNCPYDCT
jgi:hypothetical protein